jgi:response regulator RpfG family c-di-GMP phosphodiesterase
MSAITAEARSLARVIVAEDDPTIRSFCERLLRLHYNVTAVENGKLALELLQQGEYDLVLADLQMPQMGGLELLAAVRQHNLDIDVVILTAHATVDTARQALKLGALDYLSKPVEAENLERTVRSCLELRRVRREKERLSDLVATYQFSQLIANTLDTDAQVLQIAEFLWRRFSPDSLALSMIFPEQGELALLIARANSGRSPRAQVIALSHDVADTALMQAHMRLMGGPGVDDPSLFVGTVMRIHHRAVGYVHLTRNAEQPAFGPDDRRMLEIFASQIAASLDNARLYRSLKDLSRQTIAALSEAIDARDSYTYGHSRQVTRYAVRLGEELGLSTERLGLVDFGGLLHDVGKIGIRDSILLKPGPLTEDEFAAMRQHPLIGVKILEQVRGLHGILPIVRGHHERYDGTGYPDGLAGERIPLEARIVAIADSFEAMTSNRAYRAAMPVQQAIAILRAGANIHWDGAMVEVFVRLIEREGEALKIGSTPRQRAVSGISPDTLAGLGSLEGRD